MKIEKRYFIYTEDFDAKGEFVMSLQRPWRWADGQKDEIFDSYHGYESEELALTAIQEYYSLYQVLAAGTQYLILPQYRVITES